jgi:hypothetical protein
VKFGWRRTLIRAAIVFIADIILDFALSKH